MYKRKAGWPSVVPMIEDGYPKATCPREILKHIQKFHHFIFGLVVVVMLTYSLSIFWNVEVRYGSETTKEMDLVQYTHEARKENFKVEKIIFASFHAEGVGTQRQSIVEGSFFSSPMRT
jgi:hypothetical protein